MDRLHAFLVFLRVVEEGSLSGAARALGVSTPAVSASLSRLESRLAVRLLNRTTRRMSVTAEGSELYARCKQIAADLEEMELALGEAGRIPSGRLRVGVPKALGRMWIIPNLPRFTEAYPSISLEIACSDAVAYTIAEDLDVSVQVGELHSSRLGMRRLAGTRYVVCAAPSYLSDKKPVRTPEDLAHHRCLVYRRPRNGRLLQWRFEIDGTVLELAMNGYMTFNSGEAMSSAAVAGLGIVQLADYYVQPMLQRGELVELLGDYTSEGFEISVVFPQPQHMPAKLRVFVDYLVKFFDPPPWKEVRPGPAHESETER